MGRSCEGMVALVTGASKGGTGTGVAVRLAAEGAKVAITARSIDGLERTRARIEAVGADALVLPADLSDPDGGRATLVQRTVDAFGPIDILLNDPVTHMVKPVHEFTVDELRLCAEVNLWAPWLLMSQVIPGMRERGRGWILNLTSNAAELPPPTAVRASDGSSMYGALKAALNRLTVAAAGENESVIAVNALSPQLSIATPVSVANRSSKLGTAMLPVAEIQEPTKTMVEAAHALLTGDPTVLTGRIAYSLQLLVELDRAVHDFENHELVDGWQPADLIEHIRFDERFHEGNGWPGAYDFHRVNTPYPEALRTTSPAPRFQPDEGVGT
jgi:NAD(P)-dependent dehydrogenase (short-subunit alcohol dehydrogenase family)